MITGKDIYDVLAALVPLYVAMILAYGSVRWWKIFTPDQCSGINRFVAIFAVPLLSFHFISTNDPYAMNYHFIAADSLQKVVILFALFVWHNVTKRSSLDWTITLFSLSTLPNTLVMGIPLLRAMYGDFSGSLMVQIVVLQSVIWYTFMLFLFEYRGAKALINEQFPDVAASIASFKVDSDVLSLNGREPLQADAEVGDDGKLHVVVRKSTSTRSMASSYKSHGLNSVTPRASNLTGVEIYSLQSSREPTPRGSSFNQSDFYAMFTNKMTSPKISTTPTSTNANTNIATTTNGGSLGEEVGVRFGKDKSTTSVGDHFMNGSSSTPYPAPNPLVSGSMGGVGGRSYKEGGGGPNKELHMFVWSSSASPVSDGNTRHLANRPASADFGSLDPSKMVFHQEFSGSKGKHASSENASPRKGVTAANAESEIEEGLKITPAGKCSAASGSPLSMQKKVADVVQLGGDNTRMPPASVMTRLILIMVWRKLIRNPNTYSSLFGLTWSLVSFRFNIHMPSIVKGSISILSDAGLGMAMFSLGLFMALQPKIIACGNSVAAFSMAVRFLTGPAVMAATSISIGIRGDLLRVAIVQASLPQGIVPFVFAKEYNCHPDILSTAVIFGMLIALPITILYYVLLGL